MESYSLLTVCCFININFISFQTYGVGFHSLACLFFMVAIFVVPVLAAKSLVKYFDLLKVRRMKRAYGNAYSQLDLRVGKIVLIEPLFFLLRRLMIAIAIVNFN